VTGFPARPLKGAAGAALAVVVLGGCMHITEATSINGNGSSMLTETLTFNPSVLSALGGEGKLVKSFATSADKQLPGHAKVSAFTDSAGWKGVEARVALANLSQLEKIETSTSGGGNPPFSKFSVSHTGSQWSLVGQVNKGFASQGSSAKTSAGATGPTLAQLKAAGFKYVVSFRVPGKIVSDNATSRSGNNLSWNMLQTHSVVKAAWTAG
jgi:hypothetical protein